MNNLKQTKKKLKFLLRPTGDGRRIIDINWESGTAERSIGRANERERFLASLSMSDEVFGTTELEVVVNWLVEGFSSTPDDE